MTTKTREEELKEEIVKLREDRRKDLKNLRYTSENEWSSFSDEKIETFLDNERHDSEYVWGNPKTDLLEAELKGIQEGKENIKCDNCSCCNAQNHLCHACLRVIKDEGKAEVLKDVERIIGEVCRNVSLKEIWVIDKIRRKIKFVLQLKKAEIKHD